MEFFPPGFGNARKESPRLSTAEDFTARYGSGGRPEHESVVRATGTLGVRLVEISGTTNANVDPPGDDILLGLTLSGRADVRWSWGEDWYRTPARTRGDFGLTPFRTEGRFDVTGTHRVQVVCLPVLEIRRRLVSHAEFVPNDFGALHVRYHRDPLVWELSRELWDIAQTPSPASDFSADAATLALIARLTRLAGRSHRIGDEARVALTIDLARLDVWLADRLAETINNDDMASAFHLSIGQFQAAIRSATGLSARQYVLRFRVRAARDRIRAGGDLGEVALACGFYDQSHLSRVTRRITGQSPSAFRRGD